jgi:KRAB domain-containing zinc finger protein
MHIEEVHSDLEKKFKCDDHCEKSFKTIQGLKKHLHSIKKRKCGICSKEVRDINLHMMQLHSNNERPYECLFCDKKFKTKREVTIHEKIHDKKFKCTLCTKKFAQKAQLDYHLKVHENPNQFRCTICEKTFSFKSGLGYHLKTHDKSIQKQFKCESCDYSTIEKQSLKRHQKHHEKLDRKLKNNPNRVKCPQCPSVIMKSNLNVHIKLVHGRKYHVQCDYCGNFSSRKQNLLKHFENCRKII